jgi:hypothetical protein
MFSISREISGGAVRCQLSAAFRWVSLRLAGARLRDAAEKVFSIFRRLLRAPIEK